MKKRSSKNNNTNAIIAKAEFYLSFEYYLRNESSNSMEETSEEDERLKNLDPKMIELIRNEIMHHGNPVTWDDISGLEFAKKTIQVK